MSGAASFVLGLLGLGASAGINAGQSIKQKKAVHKAVEEMGYVGTPDVLRMRERVRKEWWDMCGNHYILQVDLGNAYLLVTQQAGQRIDIHTVLQLGLRIEVSKSMW